MKSATFIGTVPLEWLKLPERVGNWETFETEDIFAQNFISFPHDYLFTLGSGIYPSYDRIFSSLATTPAYPLPTSTQLYVAGRDVIRWGGSQDPLEIDFDRYVFTPVPEKNLATVFKAPKSEPHHLSEVPSLTVHIPDGWKDIVEAIKRGEFR